MKHCTFAFSVIVALSASTAYAVPITAQSELSMSHTWLVNSGNVPSGIEVENLASTLIIDSDIATMLDDPAATEITNSDFVVGNPFSDPIVPVQSESARFTSVPGSANAARAAYRYSIEMEDDPEDGVFDITRRDIDQYGLASVDIVDDQIDGSAFSSHNGGRDFRFVNTTNNLISFNLSGVFAAELSARFDGASGIARASGGFGLLFDVHDGASVNYFPVAPYLTTREDEDIGAMVSDLFLANSGGVTGVSFGASASAIGDGGQTEALFSGNSRYVFGISLDPGASLLMQTRFNQVNSVEVDPTVPLPPVPVPASLPLMLAGLAGFAALRRTRKTH